MSLVIPIKELKDTARISDLCHATDKPIYVTKNGYVDMVVMSMAAYEERIARIDIYAKIMEGKIQADNGELLDGLSTLAGLKAKYIKQI